ncbi:MAG: alpha/beta hydrolase [Acidobacteriota bacterium]
MVLPRRRRASVVLLALLLLSRAASGSSPDPPGRMADVGGHRIHVDCRGTGGPTVVVESGLGDFSFDWALVQSKVATRTRICTYDRAGYAWSEPGPMPRTFDQLNLELRDALAKLGETPPFVLVGHSFGGPVVRNFAALSPSDVAGMVLVDSVFEDQRVTIQGKAVRLREGATGKPIPPPRRGPGESAPPPRVETGPPPALDPLYRRLPEREQGFQMWAQSLPGLQQAENSQREWSSEYFERMHAAPSRGTLGAIPLIVLTRARGGYSDKLDVPAAELERERLAGQSSLAALSTRGRHVVLECGHNMELEAPEEVARAIEDVVNKARADSKSVR